MLPKFMEMSNIKEIVSKNFQNKEQEGQPGPSKEVKGVRKGGKPRIVDVTILVKKLNETKAYRPGLKSRTRDLKRDPEVTPMDTSEDGEVTSKREAVKPITTTTIISTKKSLTKRSPSKNEVSPQPGNRRGRSLAISSDDESIAETARTNPRTDCDASSQAESLTLSLPDEEKRGRGRPPSTGKEVLKREIEVRQTKLDNLNKQIADMEEITSGNYDVKER